MKKLKIVVEDVKGTCYANYKIGDEIVVEDPVIEGRICIYAFSALIPYLTAAYRETPKEDWINLVEKLQCPDPKNTVTFRVERLD
ncbi:MAG: TIGR04076 family protein [Archaeoglobaceae archaeon]